MTLDRRAFLKRSAGLAGGLTLAAPLQAYVANAQSGDPTRTIGYGPLRLAEGGDLLLPEGFRYRLISRQGDPMSDGNPTPGICDGMAAFPAARGRTILMRNHENRRPFFPGSESEIPVVVPGELRYDQNPIFIGGVTKLVVSEDRRVERDFAVLGGTTTNCAGGRTPWGSWITCEEFDLPGPDAVLPSGVNRLAGIDLAGSEPHGYIFEIDARTSGPVAAVAIKQAGRFYHEAVAWQSGRLYQTEDFDIGNPQQAVAYYRYTPNRTPRRAGDLARSGGTLEALRVAGEPDADLRSGVTVGEPLPVEWVTIDEPDPPRSPATDGVREQAFARGAARFTREEGTWVGNGRIYFDASNGGDAGFGQVWELDPDARTLTLIYESPGEDELDFPDNLVVAPTGDLLLCENGTPPDFVRGLTPEGRIYDFAQAVTNETEFAGACFSADGRTLFLNQNGGRGEGAPPGVTYAIWGPFASRDDPDRRPREPRRPRGPDRPRDPDRTRDRGQPQNGDGPSDANGGGRSGGDGGEPTAGLALGARGGSGDSELPFTGLPLVSSGVAAGLMLLGGALLRRRIENRAAHELISETADRRARDRADGVDP